MLEYAYKAAGEMLAHAFDRKENQRLRSRSRERRLPLHCPRVNNCEKRSLEHHGPSTIRTEKNASMSETSCVDICCFLLSLLVGDLATD